MRKQIVMVAVVSCVLQVSCLTVYQPMSGIHRPVVVDTEVANFAGEALNIHCIPKDFLSPQQASSLCEKLRILFENQGATVATITSRALLEEARLPNPDAMTLEISARMLHHETNPVLWSLSFMTLTLIPGIAEYTFVQDIKIRDSSGFLLVSDALKAKFTRYFGLSTYFGNIALDLVRDEKDKLSDDHVKTDFSNDFYPQLSQLVFNAKMRQQVLQSPNARASAQ